MKKCMFSIFMLMTMLFSLLMISCTGYEYTVKYYKELSEGNYVESKIERLYSGDSVLNFEPGAEEHYTVNYVKSKLTGDFTNDENVVLEVYYDAIRYSVTFDIGGLKLVSGELSQKIFYGTNAIAPIVSDTDKAKFVSWDVSFENVSSNLVVKAICNNEAFIKVFNKFENLDGTYTTVEKEILTVDATLGVYTYNPNGAEYYTVNSELSVLSCDPKVNSDNSIVVVYDREVYDVKFELNGLDHISGDLTQSIKYGQTPVAPFVKDNSKCKFIGWDGSFDNITEDVTIKALVSSDSVVKVYTKLQKLDGTYEEVEVETLTVDALKGDYLHSPKNIDYYVVNNDLSVLTCVPSVLEETKVVVVYDREVYEVKFDVNDLDLISGELIQTIKYGETPVAPVVKNNSKCKFVKWDTSLENITSDVTIKALVSSEADVKVVVYKENLDGEYVFFNETVIKVNTKDGEYTHKFPIIANYVFIGDKSNLTCIPDMLEVQELTLYYDLQRFTVTFEIGDLSHVSGELEQTIPYGGSAIAPEVSGTRTSAFKNWDKSFNKITGNLTVKAVCTTDAKITIVNYFENLTGGYTVGEKKVMNVSALPETYTYNPAPVTNYNLNETLTNSSCPLYAGEEQTLSVYYDLKRYTVVFDLGELTLANGALTQSIPHGGKAIAPTVTESETIKFNKWNIPFDNVTSDLTVVAVVDVYNPVYTRADLECVALDLSANYILLSDISLSSAHWTTLGVFSGKFLGNGHVISGLSFDGRNETGLFANNKGIIDGVVFKDCKVNYSLGNADGWNINTSFVACKNEGTIKNCRVIGSNSFVFNYNASANVGCYSESAFKHFKWSTTFRAGSYAAYNYGLIENCTVEGSLNFSIKSDVYYIYNTLLPYTNAGNGSLTITAYGVFGGFCAENNGNIEKCTSNANIKSTSSSKSVSDQSGVGRNDASAYTSVTYGSVTGINNKVINGCRTLVPTYDNSSVSTNCDKAHAANYITTDSNMKSLVGSNSANSGTITNSVATTS